MESLFDALPYLNAYRASFTVLGVVSLVTLLQNGLTAPLAFVTEEQVPGMPLRFDHSKLSFRASRTFSNSAESLPAFGFALLVAIAAGGSAPWVNGLALLFLVARLAFWAIYYSGIGKTAGGPRTLAYVTGLASNIGLACLALWALT